MEAIKKVGPNGHLEIEKPSQNAISTFKEIAKGMGRLKFHPHEAYEDEMEKCR